MSNQPLSLFISSKMQELAEERRQVQAALIAYRMAGWLWETDAGARPEPIRSTYLQEVEDCDIYLGLFWHGYGPYTIEEYEHARLHQKPCLIYEKRSNLDQRDPRLQAFLDGLQQVNAPNGLTISRFESTEELSQHIQKDVVRLLTTVFRQRRQQPPLFLVPYPRNPLFTGREQLLEKLHKHFQQTSKAALTQSQAITGLGGIGKTQLAVEYAYRYQQDYRHVLWANTTTALTLTEAYATIAKELQLLQVDEADQSKVVKAVKDWLRTHDHWLLILDNADDLAMTAIFLPASEKGHVLLTTREAATRRIAPGFEVDKMTQAEGILFLLKRAGILASAETSLSQIIENDLHIAEEIVYELDGLPLALEQAGAYIEEQNTTLATYLKTYQRRRTELLSKQGRIHPDYPYSVAATWSLNFEYVEREDPRAADLLRFLAFLAPDAIPEELIIEGASELGSNLQALSHDDTLLEEAIGTLRHFSLIQRNPGQNLLFIHRLVQAVLKDGMSETIQAQWAEQTIRAVNQAFPDGSNIGTWPQCKRFLSHALMCSNLIKTHPSSFREAAQLLSKLGNFLYEQGQYSEAKSALEQALIILEKTLGTEHPDVAALLTSLGTVHSRLGKHKQAELNFKRALKISEKTLGTEHPATAQALSGLGATYNYQMMYRDAESFLQRALAIREKTLELEHSATAFTINNLAYCYYKQGKYEQAEPLYQRALTIREKSLGTQHPIVAQSLNNLAMLYKYWGKYEQAEPLYQRALTIREKSLDPQHPDIAKSLNNLAVLYSKQNKHKQAESLYKRALSIDEQSLGFEHPDTIAAVENLVNCYKAQGKKKQTRLLYEQVLAMCEQLLGTEHPYTKKLHENYSSM